MSDIRMKFIKHFINNYPFERLYFPCALDKTKTKHYLTFRSAVHETHFNKHFISNLIPMVRTLQVPLASIFPREHLPSLNHPTAHRIPRSWIQWGYTVIEQYVLPPTSKIDECLLAGFNYEGQKVNSFTWLIAFPMLFPIPANRIIVFFMESENRRESYRVLFFPFFFLKINKQTNKTVTSYQKWSIYFRSMKNTIFFLFLAIFHNKQIRSFSSVFE